MFCACGCKEKVVNGNLYIRGHNLKGRKQTKEHVKKRVETRMKKGSYVFSDEHRRNLSKALKGHKRSRESIEKQRKAIKGKRKPPRSAEHCRKISKVALRDENIKRITEMSKNHSTYTNGHFLSDKSLRPLFFRSSLELKAYELLEDLGDVVKIEYEPYILEYEYKGKRKKYIPDMLITTRNGDIFLIEVKPTRRIMDHKKLDKIASAVDFCSKNGIQFVLIDDREISTIAKSGEFRELLCPMDMETLSQATKGNGFVEGATTRFLSPNNNRTQERPTLY